MGDARVLFVPRNPAGTVRHGGVRRTEQIAELLAATRLPVETVDRFPHHTTRLQRFVHGPLRAAAAGRPAGGWRTARQQAGRYAQLEGYREALAARPAAGVVVVENTRDHWPLVAAARRAGRRVVCAPHDVEALSAGLCRHDQPFPGWRPLWEEVAALGRADAVVTISYEEQWLLRGLGVAADALPPYPDAAAGAEAAAVRAARGRAAPAHLLLLGSAIHPPTRAGMVEAIDWLAGWPGRPWPVTVVGFGTEALTAAATAAGFTVVGEASPAALAGLLTTAVAVVAHQQAGAGALTRIPELLLAGVPVVANRIAARTAWGLPGVHVYDDPAGLRAILAGPLAPPPELPRPVAAEARFVAAVVAQANAPPVPGGRLGGPL